MFAFRLALQLGFAHPDIMLARMSSSQFAEWMAFERIEPFGEYRQELRNGKLMALMADINRDPDKKPEPFIPLDFMSFIDKPEPGEKEETPEEIERRLDREFFGL